MKIALEQLGLFEVHIVHVGFFFVSVMMLMMLIRSATMSLKIVIVLMLTLMIVSIRGRLGRLVVDSSCIVSSRLKACLQRLDQLLDNDTTQQTKAIMKKSENSLHDRNMVMS